MSQPHHASRLSRYPPLVLRPSSSWTSTPSNTLFQLATIVESDWFHVLWSLPTPLACLDAKLHSSSPFHRRASKYYTSIYYRLINPCSRPSTPSSFFWLSPFCNHARSSVCLFCSTNPQSTRSSIRYSFPRRNCMSLSLLSRSSRSYVPESVLGRES